MNTPLGGVTLCPDCRTAFLSEEVRPGAQGFPPHPCSVTLKPVLQYGPEWVAHIAAGGEVRQGNLLVKEA